MKKCDNLSDYIYFKHNQHFKLDVSVSARDLHQKKFVQFFFRFSLIPSSTKINDQLIWHAD